MKYKIGDKVIVESTGSSYSNLANNNIFGPPIIKYIDRYRPINVKNYQIFSGYAQSNDLSKQNLQWKIRYCFHNTIFNNIYIISSNQNHILVIEENGLKKATI